MVVISTEDEWSSLVSLLQESSGHQFTFSSQGSNQVYDLMLDGRSVSLHYADLKQDTTEESISQAMDGCFRSCAGGIKTFLLLIQGGHYTKRERRMVEILQAHFGAEALKHLTIVSLDEGKVVDMLDDALVELINTCDGRYCQITSSAAREKLGALLVMVDYMLVENGGTGYTENTLAEAKRRSTEDSAMQMLKQKVQEAEERAQTYKQQVCQREERRAKEMEELKVKHAEERRQEAAEEDHFKTKRESLQEAVISHKAMLQVQKSVNGGKTDFYCRKHSSQCSFIA